MARARRPSSFDAFRVGPGSDEEVRVGAYARRQLRRRILIGVVGTVMIVGAMVIYQRFRAWSGTGARETYPVRVRCISCDHRAAVRVPFAQTFPIACPACGEVTCRPLWQCRDCGVEFVPEQVGTLVRCPRCNGQRVGSAAAP